MPDVDIVVVNYRSAAYTAACVGAAHTVARGDGVKIDIIVVNNEDPAADLEAAVTAQGPASFVHNVSNVGFGAACNIGAGLGTARFILFLNPDARLKAGALRAMVAFMDEPTNAGVGIVGPAIENEEGAVEATCSHLPTIAELMARSVGLTRGFLPVAQHEKSGAVGQVIGAVLMIRRQLFEGLGGFDSRFFLYYEDVDLCARAGSQHALTYYLSTARAGHIGRVSSSHDTGMALALFIRSRLTYARLHFGVLSQGALVAVSYLAELPLRLLRTIFGGRSISGVSVLRAYRLLTLSLLSGTNIAQLATRTRQS